MSVCYRIREYHTSYADAPSCPGAVHITVVAGIVDLHRFGVARQQNRENIIIKAVIHIYMIYISTGQSFWKPTPAR